MISKVILMLLGAILVLQGIDAAPYSFKDKDSALGALIGRLKLLHFAESEQSVIDRAILSKDTEIFEKVLNDPQVIEIKSESMDEILKRIRKVIDDYNEIEKSGKRYGLTLSKVWELYDMIAGDDGLLKEDTPEAKAITKSLKENGFVQFDKSTDPRLKVFTDKFYVELQKYVDGLSEAEKRMDTEVVELLEALKNETKTEERDALIWKFFWRISLENFLWA